MPGSRVQIGALDIDDGLTVDLAERVEGRARAQRHVGHRHGREQHTERHNRHQRDQQRQNPPVHAANSRGYARRFTDSVTRATAGGARHEYR